LWPGSVFLSRRNYLINKSFHYVRFRRRFHKRTYVIFKEHFTGGHYNWQTEIKHENLTSLPDRRRFDPANGNQLLYIINFFGASVGKMSINDGQKIESLIAIGLPSELKSEIAVFNWLRGKYLYYWN
jgi:hypothetical protein